MGFWGKSEEEKRKEQWEAHKTAEAKELYELLIKAIDKVEKHRPDWQVTTSKQELISESPDKNFEFRAIANLHDETKVSIFLNRDINKKWENKVGLWITRNEVKIYTGFFMVNTYRFSIPAYQSAYNTLYEYIEKIARLIIETTKIEDKIEKQRALDQKMKEEQPLLSPQGILLMLLAM